MIRQEIFQSRITTGSYREMLDEIFRMAGQSSYVCFANVHMVMEAHRDPHFRRVVNGADVVTPDGKPVSILLRLFYGIRQDRVCGMDVLPDILGRAERENKSVYFYGTTPEILDAIRHKTKNEFPRLSVSGLYSPPFRTLTEEEKQDIIFKINSAAPDFVFVALGCPKQEKWMAAHKGKINACMLGLGQAFHVYAGKEKRLPKWMRSLSLEWAYRLYLEPKRLWKRYLVTNTLFVFLSIGQLIYRGFHAMTSQSQKIFYF